MRRSLLSFAACTLLLAGCEEQSSPVELDSAGAPALSVTAVPAGAYVPGRVLARFRPGANGADVARAHGASLERELLLRGVWMLRVPEGREGTVAQALSRNPNVQFAEPDYLRTVGLPCASADGDCVSPSDPYFGYKWDLHNDGTINNSTGALVTSTAKVDADIDWLEAYDQLGAFQGAAVIGVLDTGVLPTHADLSGRVLTGRDFVNGDLDAADDHGHGTHVAGIAAARADNLGVSGVAYGANIRVLPVKVCGADGCPTSAIVDGIVWASDNGAHVLNLSLGGRFGSTSEQQALQYALSRNVLPFCATGNDRSSVSYPAKFPECVAVGATDWGDNRASYSNYGPEVDLAAPGGDSENRKGYSYILSTSYDGGYVFMAGTSMATPQAAGLAALLHAQGVTGAETLRTRLTSTADDLGTEGLDSSFGHGRINAFRAINNVTVAPTPPPPTNCKGNKCR